MPSSRNAPLRVITVLVSGIECAVWLLFVLDFLFASGSQEGKHFSQMFAGTATALFVTSGAPALVLAYLNRWLWLAAIFAFWPLPVVGYVWAVISR